MALHSRPTARDAIPAGFLRCGRVTAAALRQSTQGEPGCSKPQRIGHVLPRGTQRRLQDRQKSKRQEEALANARSTPTRHRFPPNRGTAKRLQSWVSLVFCELALYCWQDLR